MLTNWLFNHIGIAVHEIEPTAQLYRTAGYTQTEVVFDPIQNVYICFLSREGMPMVELLAPHDTTSPVQQTLDKMGVTPYHMCYMVKDLEESITELRKQRYIVVRKPEPAIAFDNKRVCFLYNKQVGLIELVEQ